jgi:hypothetical protein
MNTLGRICNCASPGFEIGAEASGDEIWIHDFVRDVVGAGAWEWEEHIEAGGRASERMCSEMGIPCGPSLVCSLLSLVID